MERAGAFYRLTKPGIIRGNMLSLLAGYFLAASLYGFDGRTLVGVVFGTALTIAGGCVFNNYLDRHIDRRMKRTRKRALVQGIISPRQALAYGSVLTVAGLIVLWLFVNPLVTILGLFASVWYVLIYGYAKRTTPWSTLIGSVCGAVPPVAGYAAASGRIDGAAIILFVLLVVWQMPHFYAIAIRRRADYRAAGIPVLAVVKGTATTTRRRIIAYLVLFCAVSPLLSIFGYTGWTYALLSLAVAVAWVSVALRTWREHDEKRWAGRVFGVSLLVLLVQCALIATGHLLP